MIKNCKKNTMEYGIRLKAYKKENLIKNHFKKPKYKKTIGTVNIYPKN